MMKKILQFFLLIVPILLFGQTVIKGKIVDQNGNPVSDATIEAKESQTISVSDSGGLFEIEAKKGETLEISSLTSGNQTLVVSTNFMTITMRSQQLQEISIGYGTAKKQDLTGSITSIKGKDIADKPNTNVISSLQGKVSGVNIVNSGKPGESPQLNIRGGGSMNGTILYVVDGVLTDDISFLNSSDVETMNILKDASSSAIYGIRASNGVVVITTKTGKKGDDKIKVSYDGYYGLQTVTNIPKMANASQYLEIMNQKNKTNYLPEQFNNNDTNWFKEVIKKVAPIQSHNLSFLGGSKNTSYSFGLGYINQESNLNAGKGINTGNNYERVTGRMNISSNLSDNLKVGINAVYTSSHTNDSNNAIYQAYVAGPILTPFNPDGSYGTTTIGNMENPRGTLDFSRGKSKGDRILADIFAEYQIIKGLNFRTHYSKDYNAFQSYRYIPEYKISGTQKSETSTLENQNNYFNNWLWENTLTWKKTFKIHDITLLGGFSRSENYYHDKKINAKNVPFFGDDTSLYQSLANPANLGLDSEDAQRRRFESFFGRVQYSLDSKYLFNATLRRDVADQFKNNNAAIFPSLGFGWIVSNEKFLHDNQIISFLKLKGSWGKLGNGTVPRKVDLGTTDDLGNFIGNGSGGAISINSVVTPEMKWEITTETDLGFELKMLKNKLSLDATYYNKDIADMVIPINILSSAGTGTTIWGNFLDSNTKGFEFQLNWDDKISEKFSYSLYGNLTTIDNKVTKVAGLGNNSFIQVGDGLSGNPIIRYEEGSQLGSYYGKIYQGVDPKTGNAIFSSTKHFLGSAIPDYTYGFGINLKYENIDFGIEFQGVAGNYIYNLNRQMKFDGTENFDADYYNNRWTQDGMNSKYPNPSSNGFTSAEISSLFVEKGDYFRIRNIQLAYNFTANQLKNIKINSIRLYLNAQNPLNIFSYNGFSPEVYRARTKADLVSGTYNIGIDNNVLPLSAIYSLGAKVNF